MNDVWPARYSPAARPSSTRAAPAKNRIWSTIGGSSSDIVIAIGLPVFSHSAATISSPRASMASAMRSSARCRTDGVTSRHSSKARAAADIARSTSAASEIGAVAKTSPVLGSTSSLLRPAAVSTYSPSTKLRKRATGRSVGGGSSGHDQLLRGDGARVAGGRCRQRSAAQAVAGDENVSEIRADSYGFRATARRSATDSLASRLHAMARPPMMG